MNWASITPASRSHGDAPESDIAVFHTCVHLLVIVILIVIDNQDHNRDHELRSLRGFCEAPI